VAESLLRASWGAPDTRRATWDELCRRFVWPPKAFLAIRDDDYAYGLINVGGGNFHTIVEVMGGIHGIGDGLVSHQLLYAIELAIEGNHPVAQRRLQHLIIIFQEAVEWVVWDAVFHSLLDPGNHGLCAGNTYEVRAKLLYAVLSNVHPGYYIRAGSHEPDKVSIFWHL
jgi:hypothetical protein